MAFQILLTSLFVGLILLLRNSGRSDFAAKFKGAAQAEFLALHSDCDDARFEFDGRKAQILAEKEEVETSRGVPLAYQLSRVARNEAGEYFYYLYRSDSSPYFKHIEHGAAKAILGKKYIPLPD